MIHEAAVNDVLYYADSLEAYRSDRFAGFTKQPEEGGVITGQNGYWGFYDAAPVTASDTDTDADGGASDGLPGWVLPVGIAVVVLAALGVILGLRRRSTAADRE